MFDYLYGFVADKKQTSKGFFITLDITGIGYLFETTEHDFSKCEKDERIKFYTYLLHREDTMAMYGFSSKETRDIFTVLISVSGVGVKMALALLNQFNTCDLITFVINGNYKELTLAKGVGPKLAQKIILELKDRLIKTDACSLVSASNTNDDSNAIREAETIMLSLGYGEEEINKALSNVSREEQNTEIVLKEALLKLSM